MTTIIPSSAPYSLPQLQLVAVGANVTVVVASPGATVALPANPMPEPIRVYFTPIASTDKSHLDVLV